LLAKVPSCSLETAVDTWDPAYGSGGSVFGVGTVFLVGIGLLALGVLLMVWWERRAVAFCAGQTLHGDTPVVVAEG
jgi:hypothetical protein